MADLPDDWHDRVWIERKELDALRTGADLLFAAYIVLEVWTPNHPLVSQIQEWLLSQEDTDGHGTTGVDDDITHCH